MRGKSVRLVLRSGGSLLDPVEELWALPNGPGKLAAFLELPFTAARRASVPLTASDAYGRAPLALSLLGAPLWLCVYASRRGAENVFAARAALRLSDTGGPNCMVILWRGSMASSKMQSTVASLVF